MNYPLLGLCLSLCLALSSLQAQRKLPDYKTEVGIGGGIHTTGFTIGTYYGLIRSPQRTDLFLFDFTELKSPKERRQRQDAFGSPINSSPSYIYGKRNNLFAVRLGAGQRFSISDKTQPRSIALSLQYSGGLSLGMIKPYFLDLMYRDDMGRITVRTESYNNTNAARFLDPGSIEGPGGFQYGWNDLSLSPGLFAKASLWIDWGEWNELSKSIEIGGSLDVFSQRVPLLVFQENQRWFANLFINVYFGARWLKA